MNALLQSLRAHAQNMKADFDNGIAHAEADYHKLISGIEEALGFATDAQEQAHEQGDANVDTASTAASAPAADSSASLTNVSAADPGLTNIAQASDSTASGTVQHQPV